MNVFDGIESLSAPLARSTVAIGVFDGVHRGHRAILQTALQDAQTHHRPLVVVTFDRHPAELLAPQRAPAYLTTPEQRNAFIAEDGADSLVVLRFNQALSELTADEFMRQILKAQLGAEAISRATISGLESSERKCRMAANRSGGI